MVMEKARQLASDQARAPHAPRTPPCDVDTAGGADDDIQCHCTLSTRSWRSDNVIIILTLTRKQHNITVTVIDNSLHGAGRGVVSIVDCTIIAL